MELNIPAAIDHNEAMIAEPRENPEYAEIYLQTALKDIYEPGGVSAFLIALPHVIEARGGVALVAEKSAINRQHVYRALSKNGNPTSVRSQNLPVRQVCALLSRIRHKTESTARNQFNCEPQQSGSGHTADD